jgi:chromate transporter
LGGFVSSGRKEWVVREVFLTFLRLGSSSFGGPIAHLAYFRRTLVEQRHWVDEAGYARIVAFCSVLPGPTSSQVGMLLGLLRAGPAGGLAAWLGFTLPSAILMTALGLALTRTAVDPPPWFGGLLDGLLSAAAAVVAQAVLGLAAALCTDRQTRTIALGAAIVALAARPFPGLQWTPILLGAAAGALWLRADEVHVQALPFRVPRPVAVTAALVFVALVALTFVPPTPTFELLATLVRAGSLVFGGGHVVLPLLQSTVTQGLIPPRLFFAGYGAVQAMPGPLSSFASFLGAANTSPLHGLLGALIATVLFFLPSYALLFALAPVWNRLAHLPRVGGALRGANAGVVGLLAAILFDPILLSLGSGTVRIGIALAAFALVSVWRITPWIAVVGAAVLGALLHA